MAIVSTTSRGQVTLRKEIFQHVGIKPGEKLEIDLLPGGEIPGPGSAEKGQHQRSRRMPEGQRPTA